MKKLMLFIALIAAGCREEAKPPANDAAPTVEATAAEKPGKKKSCCAADGEAVADSAALRPTDRSLYNLESAWTTHDERTVHLHDLNGKAQVLAIIYTHCEYVCPRIVADIKRIEAAAMPKYGDKVGFVLVSMDPERDTPARLREFAAEQKLDLGRWTLWRGSADAVLELATLLGVQYKKTGATEFSHSNIITLLNDKGEIVHQQIGLETDPTETLRKLGDLFPPQS